METYIVVRLAEAHNAGATARVYWFSNYDDAFQWLLDMYSQYSSDRQVMFDGKNGEARVEFVIGNDPNRQISYHWKIIKRGEDDNLFI